MVLTLRGLRVAWLWPAMLVLGVWLATLAPAAAHGALVGSVPASGAVLDAPPQEIVLTFNEPMALVDVSLSSDDGALVGARVEAVGTAITIRPSFPPEPEAVYTLRWRVAGDDSHVVEGRIAFRVGEGPAPALAAAAASDGDDPDLSITPNAGHARDVASTMLRAIFFLAFLVSGGARLFELVLARPSGVPVRIVAGIALAALAGIFALNTLALGLALAPVVGPALAAIGLIAIAAGRGGVAAGGVVLAAAGLACWGHSQLAPRLLGQPLFALHIVAAAFWIGSLLPLYAAARDRDAAPLMRRFSASATVVVAVLLAGGLALAWVRIGWPGWDETPAYMVLLLVKIGLVAALVGLALWNRFRLLARLPASGAALARSIDLELALATLVVVAAAWLGRLPPPSA